MKWLVLALFALGCGGGASSPGPVNHPTKKEIMPYTLAIVMSDWEMWIGNEDVVDADDPSRYTGALKAIETGVAASTFAKTAPGGSQAMIVTYDDKVKIRLPMGPIDKLDAAAFGTQKDYFGITGVELVTAIELAVGELDKVKAGKKFLFVLGDGNDTNNEAAARRFTKLKADLAARGIVVVSFVYKAKLSGDTSVIDKLADDSHLASTADSLGTLLQVALDGLAGRAN